MNQKMGLDEVGKKLGAIALFIGTASFESRCLAILEKLQQTTANFLFFKNKGAGVIAEENLQKMIVIGGTNVASIELDLDRPTVTADALQKTLINIHNAGSGDIFIDITTFTHEQLLIFIKVLSEAKLDRRFIFGYTGAEQYSTNTKPQDVWLSRGVSQIRSVLGFPGEFLPSKRLHLIVLVGFEHERAKAVIEKFEPSILTLGIAQINQSVSNAHYENNERFFEEVKRFVDVRTSIYSAIETFHFSAIDPSSTRDAILAQVNKLPSYNVVVCPMNTKISTFGVGLAALSNPQMQVCYSRANIYNEKGYSTPSNQVTLFDIKFE